jgi:EAL domain-containing protein (putative c-di-GMP-specific phosphodiesterase class I)
LRWHHPERGVMVPRTFLPLAERTGLIGPIGQWVLEEACRQAAAWARTGSAIRVGVNLATVQCRQPGFVATLVGLLERFDLAADLLDLEITESWLLGSFEGLVSSNLLRLSALGVRISIDDFGTGHSSLSDLKRLPIDHIKLACPFVAGIGRSPEDEAIARALITLARSLDKRIIAEGVETEEQRLFLSHLGCDYAQGRLFGDAVPVEEIGPWLAAGPDAPVPTRPRDLAATLTLARLNPAADGRRRSGRRPSADRSRVVGAGGD